MIDTLAGLVRDALAAARDNGDIVLSELPEPHFERPRDPSHGDWSTNVAMKSAKAAGMAPRAIAEAIAAGMSGHPDIDAVEVAGPGFLNIRLSATALCRVLTEARTAGADFGKVDLGGGRRAQVEFVSANPVGPMHVGHGRWAALGDSMARVLVHAGWDVQREF
ncbi:MAG: arginine--tRNA ligase, partial [Actinomycetota bacterium]|nr:arginine--tRNA ligase [Actinomycetota bacterium]